MASRRLGGRQQIKTAITFHAADEQILWPYRDTKTDVAADMTVDDHNALVALGREMATTNGYTAMSRAASTSPTVTRSTGRTASSTSSCTRWSSTRVTAR